MTTTVRSIEDGPGDVRQKQQAFRETDAIPMDVAVDGVDAMSFSWRDGCNACVSCPDLILPALNLLKMVGHAFWLSGRSLTQRLQLT